MLKKLYLLFILIFSVNLFIINAQSITVLSESTGEPVENAALFSKDKSRATLTDSVGIANISIFKENDSIFFQHPSYRPLRIAYDFLLKNPVVELEKRVFLIDEFIISATKSRENKRNVAFQVDILEESYLMQNTATSSAEILQSTGNLVVQKSQAGGGSPILRGFEANKVLLVLDGVRMNNAIYRSGHLQNSITIDNTILERVEVVYGPTSLIYGSDALGGVVHYYTKDPSLATKDKNYSFEANAMARYSSANSGKTGHININQGFNKIGFLTSITHKDFGDIQMGRSKNPFYGNFGEIRHYVERYNGQDSTFVNRDPYIQKNTGYSQTDLLQKIKYSPSSYYDLILNFQYSTSSNIDRLDKLNDYSGQNLKYAEYYYGPQNRLFASAKSVIKRDNRLFTNLTSILAWQKIDEDRRTRRFRNNEKFYQEEDVSVLSMNMDFLKLIGKNRLNYGLELIYNSVISEAWYRNILSGEQSPGATRYPDDGSKVWNAAFYGNYKWNAGKNFILSAGTRYQYGSYISDFKSGGTLPYNSIEINNGALTGSLNMVYSPGRKWRINAILSSGFRIPNVDDYGKVRAKNAQVTVPNPNLKPEYTYNFEVGVIKTIEGYIKLNATAYYTLMTDAIVRAEASLNGEDSLEYDGEMYRIITNENASRAYIRGLSLGLVSDLNSNLSFKSTLNLTEGRNITDDVPLGHIPPVFGRTTVKYQMKRTYTEIFVDYNGWKKMADMSPYEEDNDAEATEYGFPSWYTVNIRAGYSLTRNIHLQLALENIFDSFYKPFASGVAGPGRNFILTLRANI